MSRYKKSISERYKEISDTVDIIFDIIEIENGLNEIEEKISNLETERIPILNRIEKKIDTLIKIKGGEKNESKQGKFVDWKRVGRSH